MTRRGIFLAVAGATLVVGTVVATHRRMPSIKIGSLYSLSYLDSYRVAKVLAVDEAVHLRIYKQEFATRPTRVDESKLSVGTSSDRDGFGWSHVPVSRVSFTEMKPMYLQPGTVTKGELADYETWRKEGGGVWF